MAHQSCRSGYAGLRRIDMLLRVICGTVLVGCWATLAANGGVSDAAGRSVEPLSREQITEMKHWVTNALDDERTALTLIGRAPKPGEISTPDELAQAHVFGADGSLGQVLDALARAKAGGAAVTDSLVQTIRSAQSADIEAAEQLGKGYGSRAFAKITDTLPLKKQVLATLTVMGSVAPTASQTTEPTGCTAPANGTCTFTPTGTVLMLHLGSLTGTVVERDEVTGLSSVYGGRSAFQLAVIEGHQLELDNHTPAPATIGPPSTSPAPTGSTSGTTATPNVPTGAARCPARLRPGKVCTFTARQGSIVFDATGKGPSCSSTSQPGSPTAS
jgi:hypothetical protein